MPATPKDPSDDQGSFFSRLPRRNLRRALFLLAALLAVLAIKYSGGSSVGTIFDTVAPTPASGTMRLHVTAPDAR